jgi:hypothetical protein
MWTKNPSRAAPGRIGDDDPAANMGGWVLGVGLLGVAALGLALAVAFVPGLAAGLHQAASPGGMGGMW